MRRGHLTLLAWSSFSACAARYSASVACAQCAQFGSAINLCGCPGGGLESTGRQGITQESPWSGDGGWNRGSSVECARATGSRIDWLYQPVKASEQEIDRLLDWLCRHWGFCIPADERLKIARRRPLAARDFAIAVLRAEGFVEPEMEIKWMRQLAARFVEHFGTTTIPEED